jgi:hypothetical protein
MAKSITASNALFFLTIPGVFFTPQQLQGFAADDVFEMEGIQTSEVLMGIDGVLSAGFVFVAVPQSINLQADSNSVLVFDAWYAAEQAAGEKIRASGFVEFPALRRKWAMSGGVLTNYKPMPGAGKTLRPMKNEVTWERVSPAIA